MKVSLVQMDMKFAEPDINFARAEQLIRQAAQQGPDVITLPETWNVGFFPKDNLVELSDQDGCRVKEMCSKLSKELNVNLVAGSVSNVKNGKVYNTSYVFNRQGECVAEYDKTHLFTPMNEHDYFAFGDHVSRFTLDGVSCGIIICYDMRFPELIRTMTVPGIDVLFIVAQWPAARKLHWQILSQARAVENQCFVVATNSCGAAGETQYGGFSVAYDPWGEILGSAGAKEMILTVDMDLEIIKGIRESINVYKDRKPDLYHIG